MRPLRLSNSEMEQWRRCRRKWLFATYRCLRPRVPPPPGSSLSIGDEVHDALAAYYDPVRRENPVEHAERAFERQLQENPIMAGPVRQERELVVTMLSGYLDWLAETGADADLCVLGSESMVEVGLVSGVTLVSKLDAPVERVSDGARLALEHKTTGSLEQSLGVAKQNTQFLTEHLARFLHAVEQGAGGEEAYRQCQGVLLNMLRKVKRTAAAKPPFYARVDIPHNLHELRNHWRHVVTVARDVQQARYRLDAGEIHHRVCPPSPQASCAWDCPFFGICVMADDGSDIEGALEAIFEQSDPLARYAEAAPLK